MRRDLLQLERARKRDDAGQREMETDVQCPARHVSIARETVKDPSDIPCTLLVEDPERIVFRLACVNHDRPLQPPRQPDLLAEHLLLDVAWARSRSDSRARSRPRPRAAAVLRTPAAPAARLPRDLMNTSRGMRVHANRESHLAPVRTDRRGLT